MKVNMWLSAMVFVVCTCMVGAANAVVAGVAATPPMGWNSWNYFAGKVTAADVRAAADAMVSTGMPDAGYVYVNIDDTWQGKRDAEGRIHPNARFPDMKALADYVHAKGLKLGIYSSPGPTTCAGFAGSYGHEAQDAKTYAAWGVDYLKYDLCSFSNTMHAAAPNDDRAQMQMMRAAYEKMYNALQATGRPIVYSLCQYGWDSVWRWAPKVGGNLWRTTGDIEPNWNRIYTIVSAQAGLAAYAGPGHWNDPDMLEVGNGKLTLAEDRAHFSWWAMLAAPLIAGNDLAHMKPQVLKILTNHAVIAVDQDSLGKQGMVVQDYPPELQVWVKPLADGSRAVVLFNRASVPTSMTANWGRIGITTRKATVRDLWAHKDLGVIESRYTATVPSHGVVMLRVTPVQN